MISALARSHGIARARCFGDDTKPLMLSMPRRFHPGRALFGSPYLAFEREVMGAHTARD